MRRLAILARVRADRRRAGRATGLLPTQWTDAALWPAKGSDSVRASNAAVPGGKRTRDRAALRLRPGVGLCLHVRRKAASSLPRNYEIRFRIRGSGGRNDLQMKLTNGDNVWWKVWRNYRPPDAVAGDRRPGRRDRLRLGADARTRRCAAPTGSSSSSRAIAMAARAASSSTICGSSRCPARRPSPRRPKTAPTTRIAALAKASPRGTYPRAFIGEQPYWTLAGSDGGKVAALISEDAAIEPAKGSYSIEPGGDRRRATVRLGQCRRSASHSTTAAADPDGALDRARVSRSTRPCSPTARGAAILAGYR